MADHDLAGADQDFLHEQPHDALAVLNGCGDRGFAEGRQITDHRGEQMLADYARLRITRHPVWPYHPRMWELRHNLGAYDAAHIALAEALGCELLTGDVKLKNAAGHRATVIVTR